MSLLPGTPYLGCLRVVAVSATLIGEGGTAVFSCDSAGVYAMEIGGSNVNLVDLSFTTTSGLSNGIFVQPGALNANLQARACD